jgi:hypothetical protein
MYLGTIYISTKFRPDRTSNMSATARFLRFWAGCIESTGQRPRSINCFKIPLADPNLLSPPTQSFNLTASSIAKMRLGRHLVLVLRTKNFIVDQRDLAVNELRMPLGLTNGVLTVIGRCPDDRGQIE